MTYLSGINVGWADGAVTREVFTKSLGIRPDLTEVHGLTTTLQKQQPVEALEQERRGLMDGAKNRLAALRQLAEESHQVPGALTVQS